MNGMQVIARPTGLRQSMAPMDRHGALRLAMTAFMPMKGAK